ncbi:MAG: glycosyl transferase [Flavobacteriaceae bacterium]|nr:glycosyl transferase [Flavobacteriaceae bacterium]|tara:strand:- start:19332 stop:20141 length:810 start_codon:yes stop_codon:yes gene_type:complete
MPKLTIITVNYNNEVGLRRTLESVFSQSDPSFETIVIDGNSTDGSQEVLQSFDAQLTKWSSEPDQGVYDAMNKGIAQASGEYVLFLNSGDHFYAEDVCEKAMPHLEGAEIIAFDVQLVAADFQRKKTHPNTMTFGYLYEDTLAHQSTVIKRTLLADLGGYDTTLKIASDWKFFLKAFVEHKVSYKKVPLCLSTNYLDGMSCTPEGVNTRKEERRRTLALEYSLFLKDYQRLELFQRTRFQDLEAVERSKVGRKLNSAWLRMIAFLFGKK